MVAWILIFLSLPLSGLFAWDYYLVFKRIKGGFREEIFKNKNKEFEILRKNHGELVKLVSDLE